MSLVVYPVVADFVAFQPSAFSLAMQTNQRAFASPFGGSEQVTDMLNDRWMCSLDLPLSDHNRAAKREAFIEAMRGQTNNTELYHFGRPRPLGTLSGTPIARATLQGAAVIVINATTGQTLLAGDMIGVAGLLLRVAADCTSSAGAITVPLANRLRRAVTVGAAVTWDRPTAPFRLASSPRVRYVGGYAEGMTLDFVEMVS
jgi:hypothetical protein